MTEADILKRDVQELSQTIYGTGANDPGIRSKVERIETRMETGIRILWGLLILAVPSAVSLITTAIMLILQMK